jgi:hypothetical protein
MRYCLTYGAATTGSPLATHEAGDIRGIAARYFGTRRDADALSAILNIASSDSVIGARTESAKALGDYADPRAIPVLRRILAEEDAGHESEGHADGALHLAAVESLGKIGTDAALEAIYDGLSGAVRRGSSAQYCISFWMERKEKGPLEKLLEFDKNRPLEKEVLAGLVAAMLRERDDLRIPANQAAASKQSFLATVDDHSRFGPAADLSRGGTFDTAVEFEFFTPGFAMATFTFHSRATQVRGMSAHTVLYRQVQGVWIPLGVVMNMVS